MAGDRHLATGLLDICSTLWLFLYAAAAIYSKQKMVIGLQSQLKWIIN